MNDYYFKYSPMNYHIISIFPEIFDSFLSVSLISKAVQDKKIFVHLINPRDFCSDKHKQIDDEPYGWGAGMLIKAQPVIDAIKSIDMKNKKVSVILLSPSETVYNQSIAHKIVDEYTDLILICWRYEGLDNRVRLWCQKEFDTNFTNISLGQYITLWWEVPAMSIIESTARLVSGVIKEEVSWQQESYRPEQWMNNIEYPQYTRPQEVEWFEVPEVLLSGHHEEIRKWREDKWKNL